MFKSKTELSAGNDIDTLGPESIYFINRKSDNGSFTPRVILSDCGISGFSSGAFGGQDRADIDFLDLKKNDLTSLEEDPFKEFLSFMHLNSRELFQVSQEDNAKIR